MRDTLFSLRGRLTVGGLLVLVAGLAGCNDLVVATIGGPTGGVLTGHVSSECRDEGSNCHWHSISGAVVEVRDAEDLDRTLATGRTAWNGSFWLSGVPADADVVVLVRDDYRGTYAKEVRTHIDKFGFGYAGTIHLPIRCTDEERSDETSQR